jgi:hypothetical protein
MRKSIKFHKHRAGSVASPRTQQGTGARPARGSPARGPREGWLFYIGPAAGKPLADARPCVNVCKRRAGAPGSARTTRGQPARRWAGGGGCAPGRRLPQAINTSPSDPAPRWCAMAHPPRVGIAARQARRGGRVGDFFYGVGFCLGRALQGGFWVGVRCSTPVVSSPIRDWSTGAKRRTLKRTGAPVALHFCSSCFRRSLQTDLLVIVID